MPPWAFCSHWDSDNCLPLPSVLGGIQRTPSVLGALLKSVTTYFLHLPHLCGSACPARPAGTARCPAPTPCQCLCWSGTWWPDSGGMRRWRCPRCSQTSSLGKLRKWENPTQVSAGTGNQQPVTPSCHTGHLTARSSGAVAGQR